MSQPSILPRRNLLGSLVALVALPRATPAAGPGPEPEAAAIPAPTSPTPASAIFDLGRHWRITHDGDTWSAEKVARWDVPGIGDAEQPMPVATEQKSFGPNHLLFRYWRPEDVGRCSLCPSCNATGNTVRPELRLCMRAPVEMLAEEDAPLYRTGLD